MEIYIYIYISEPLILRYVAALGFNSSESLSGTHYILETSHLILVSSFPIKEAVMWMLRVDFSYFFAFLLLNIALPSIKNLYTFT